MLVSINLLFYFLFAEQQNNVNRKELRYLFCGLKMFASALSISSFCFGFLMLPLFLLLFIAKNIECIMIKQGIKISF